MALQLLVIDPGTDGQHCPAVILDTESGDLLFQGPQITEEDQLAQVNQLSPIGPGEVVGRIPQRMRASILQALLEADGADSGADRLQ